MSYEDIQNRFTYHAPNDDQVKLHEEIREMHRQLAHLIDQRVPDGRHKALALTALQESSMWANAAIACDS